MAAIQNDWLDALQGEFRQPYYKKLFQTVNEEYRTRRIFPPADDIFNAFHLTPLRDVKVVILGQDPYHEPGQAHGLCFSVQKGVQKPPSLVNIFKELQDDLGIDPPSHGNLESWAKNGVLLLNTVLTVRRGTAGSHRGQGWEIFTDQVIQHLNAREKPMVFILWGGFAKAKEALITGKQHCIIKSVHPSPLSAHRGYFGGKYFSRTNAFLQSTGQEPIDWSIPE